MTITFRPITQDDIPTLHRWRNLPHVAAWWDPSDITLAQAQEEYGAYLRADFGVGAYIIRVDGADVGYIQRWRVRDFPDYRPYVAVSDHSTGIDLFIGDPARLHQGLGAQIITAFLRDYVFNDPAVPEAIIDPVPENAAAIRAYEKAGFVHEKTFTHDGKGVYFMRLARARFQPQSTD